MRTLLLALTSVLLLSSPSQAGIFDVSAVLTFGGPFGLTTSAIGSASGVQSVGGGIAQVPGMTFSGSVPLPTPQFGLTDLTIMAAVLGPGTLSGPGGPLGIQGALIPRFGNFPGGSLPLTPLGGGGVSTSLLSGIFKITLQGSTWKTGAVTAFGTGAAPATAMATGGDNRTPGGAGSVSFVTASTFIFSAIPSTHPATSMLTLTYTLAAPEPTLSFAALVAALVLAGRVGRLRD